ncbi:MAG: hypothetical protein U0M02_13915 [Acutalibacteraceae bacterium]|nr:hypothetical protein [Acutalibacteraceae bacterium]
MTDKLTGAEVKKALEWHLNEVNHCDGCPLFVLKNTTTYCVDVLMQNALDLINRQEEKIKKFENRQKPTGASGYKVENGKVVFFTNMLGGCKIVKENLEEVVKTLNELLQEAYSKDEIAFALKCKTEELDKAKAEVERLKKVEERHMRLYHLLLDPVIVANGKNGELRPIKRTSRQDVYHTLLRAQEIMKIPHRWFPWKRDGDNK